MPHMPVSEGCTFHMPGLRTLHVIVRTEDVFSLLLQTHSQAGELIWQLYKSFNLTKL